MNEAQREHYDLSITDWRICKNRCPQDIIDRILLMCQSGEIKTRVMYKCNLNSKQIKAYLDFLLDRKLVVKEMDPRFRSKSAYLTTEKGRRYIDAYGTLWRLLEIDPDFLEP